MEIEKNIPLPIFKGDGKYPLGKMEVGDSFKVESSKVNSVRTAANYTKYDEETKNWKFTVRKEEDHYRCWRIK